MFFNGLIQTAHRYRKPLSILSIVVVFFLILAFLHYLSSRYSSGSLGLCLGSLVLYSLAHNFRLRGAIGLECAALFGWGLGFAYLSQISFTLAWHWQPILVALGVTSSSAAVWCAGVLAGSRQIPVGKLFALSAPLFIGVLCLNRQLPVWYLLCFLTLPIVVRSDRAHLWICLMFNGLLLIAGLLSR